MQEFFAYNPHPLVGDGGGTCLNSYCIALARRGSENRVSYCLDFGVILLTSAASLLKWASSLLFLMRVRYLGSVRFLKFSLLFALMKVVGELSGGDERGSGDTLLWIYSSRCTHIANLWFPFYNILQLKYLNKCISIQQGRCSYNSKHLL